MIERRSPPEQTIVIFGASGDLTSRKLVPALYRLYQEGLLPAQWSVIGYSRTQMDTDEFRTLMREAVEGKPGFGDASWQEFASRISYLSGSYDGPEAMVELASALDTSPGSALFYCATPPSAYEPIVRTIGERGLERGARLVIEKPFGRDLDTARRLNALVHDVFAEDQVFRIDHYLGKETVMNILVFRFANGMFEPTWNRRYVTRVEVTVAEESGIGHRGSFYEEAGALRDIVQNHIFQILTFLAMEPPVSFEPEALRDEKAKVLSAVRPVDPSDVVRGQYTASGEIPGYVDEAGVASSSDVETFVAMRLWIDTWRWADVPFYVRTGKRLPRRVTEVTLAFHDAPKMLFAGSAPEPNHLTLRIQPDEGICLSFDAKKPGPAMDVTTVDMDFSYQRHFGDEPPEAYERLLRDALVGDHTLFPRADEVERAWAALEHVQREPPPVRTYQAGTWGPKEADALIEQGAWHVR